MNDQSDLALARDIMPEAVREVERAERRALERRFPKPTEMDILETKQRLEGLWHEWRFGSTETTTEDGTTLFTPGDGIPGAVRVRAMRYHRDRMPRKWEELLNVPYRYRSNLTASEIDRTVALATRNVPRIEVKASGREPDAQERADRETRWAQFIIPALERMAGEPLLRKFADAAFESGHAVFEVYLTDAYDNISPRRPGESYEDWYERTGDEVLALAEQFRLPVGVRVPDPLSVMVERDDYGVKVAVIAEKKPYREIYADLLDRLGDKRVEELRLPRPGTPGWPDTSGYDARFGTPSGEAETIRLYDRYWYVYMVAGKIVDGPHPHGFPGVPIITAYGNTTSSANLAEQLQGVAWGMVEQEQAINDWITVEIDVAMTYGRPAPVVTRHPEAPNDVTDGPSSVDLSNPRKAPRLRPGERIDDAYGNFQHRIPPHVLNIMMQIRERNGMSPTAQGESPGSDPSGFAINSLQAAGQMRYEIWLDNLGRSVGMLIDFIRRSVKYGPILDTVMVPVETKEGLADFLGLGPEDISDMPAVVTLDPMNDVNRLAIRQSLIAGNQAGYIDRREVQVKGFGVDDIEAMDNRIALDTAKISLIGMALEEAKRRVLPQQDSGLVGPDGQPISSRDRQAGDQDEMERLGGVPTEPRGTGRMQREAGTPPAVATSNRANAARSRGGQRPANQGAPV